MQFLFLGLEFLSVREASNTVSLIYLVDELFFFSWCSWTKQRRMYKSKDLFFCFWCYSDGMRKRVESKISSCHAGFWLLLLRLNESKVLLYSVRRVFIGDISVVVGFVLLVPNVTLSDGNRSYKTLKLSP